MSQPCPDDALPAVSSHAGIWFLVGLVFAIIAIEGFLIATHRPTMSQAIKRATDGKPWWKVFAAGVIGVTIFHLLFGGPL